MTVQQVKDSVKEALSEGKFLSVDDRYERTAAGYLLTYSIFYMTYETSFTAYTKFSFMVNKEKTETLEDKLVVLRDLNCNYKVVDYKDAAALVNVIKYLMKNGYDKGDIRELSDMLVDGNDGFNQAIKNAGVDNFVYSVEMAPELAEKCPNIKLRLNITDNDGDNQVILGKRQDKWSVTIGDEQHELNELGEIYALFAGSPDSKNEGMLRVRTNKNNKS